jgi:two-component system nitrogen regulation response regulator NtrX
MEKILLIDDDAVMVNLLRTLLEIEGYTVSVLPETQDIISEIRKQNPNAIILDVFLNNFHGNDIDGFELLKQIRGSSKDIRNVKVIMSSGIDFEQKSEKSGADGFIHKPYMPDDLIALVKRILN